ncbi:hypothetical protein AF72_10770 [Xylella taiwanensis]|uniref:2-amino-4-hydroxy-6-hydroxymethyldihydropteridine pyrophosphokinase n=1 Tax=Xylella taiwanensis TaxID=1444770 RepID=Z9JI37_9GAMM|nr:hypothetical protein AF72_10770 [Xylella taiwanensis]
MTEIDVVAAYRREYCMTIVLLSLGSNVRPRYYLRKAEAELRACFGEVLFSPTYCTPAVRWRNAMAAIVPCRALVTLRWLWCYMVI